MWGGEDPAELAAQMDISDPHGLPGQLPPAARDAYMVFQVRLWRVRTSWAARSHAHCGRWVSGVYSDGCRTCAS